VGESSVQPRNGSASEIVVYHVGGVGDYGPVTELARRYPSNTLFILFEARSDSPEFSTQTSAAGAARSIVVNKCIGGRVGRARFYCNKASMSSSLFPPAPQAVNEHILGLPVHTWGENTELDKVIEVELTTVDALVRSGALPAPDILSIDAQGAELAILKGGAKTLESVLALVTEVEFDEIYQGQGLFHEQLEYLLGFGFRLADLLNVQYWHPAAATGAGFLTVAEALFIRRLERLDSAERQTQKKRSFAEKFFRLVSCKRRARLNALLKLGAIALAFGRKSYAYQIADQILKRHQTELAEHEASPFWKDLRSLHRHVESNLDRYRQDNTVFVKEEPPYGHVLPGQVNIDWRERVQIQLRHWEPLSYGSSGSGTFSIESEIDHGENRDFLRWTQSVGATDNPNIRCTVSELTQVAQQDFELRLEMRSDRPITVQVCVRPMVLSAEGHSVMPAIVGTLTSNSSWQEYVLPFATPPFPPELGTKFANPRFPLELRLMLPANTTGRFDFRKASLSVARSLICRNWLPPFEMAWDTSRQPAAPKTSAPQDAAADS